MCKRDWLAWNECHWDNFTLLSSKILSIGNVFFINFGEASSSLLWKISHKPVKNFYKPLDYLTHENLKNFTKVGNSETRNDE